jgi:hypothetical protein
VTSRRRAAGIALALLRPSVDLASAGNWSERKPLPGQSGAALVTTQRYLHPDGQSIAAAGAALSAHLTAMRADWSQSGPKLRLVQEISDHVPGHKDAR